MHSIQNLKWKKAAGFRKRRACKVESQEAVKRKASCVQLYMEFSNCFFFFLRSKKSACSICVSQTTAVQPSVFDPKYSICNSNFVLRFFLVLKSRSKGRTILMFGFSNKEYVHTFQFDIRCNSYNV